MLGIYAEYFFTKLKKKGKEGCKRFDRTVGNNSNWHATQTKKILDESGENVAGFLKSFVFKGDEEEHWNMDEFSLSNKNDYVLCRIKNNKKRKFGDCYDNNGEAAVPVPDLEPVTKAAKHDQFLTASTSYYLNNSREEDAPLISPASCCKRFEIIAVRDSRSDIPAVEQNLCTNSVMPLAAAEAAALPDVDAFNAAAMAKFDDSDETATAGLDPDTTWLHDFRFGYDSIT